tara:strand:+ start:792 stop:1931 length:1140 start_codon:yes stop_codon:yes gene_type:complete
MLSINEFKNIQENLLEWFIENGRHWIPWKLKQDGTIPQPGESISPYKIWIAEVMLQQTQLNIVIPYWEKWMQRFPSLEYLAESDEQEVLFHWKGLGYYARAKRVYKSSKFLLGLIGINKNLDPLFWPMELERWMELPGIGRSTAGSIISSAFDLSQPILDGNVKRILCRIFALDQAGCSDTKRLWELSSLLLSSQKPRNFNQALMDLGATVCTFKKPKCILCPLKNYCLAYLQYNPIDFPKKKMKAPIPLIEIGLGLVFNKYGELLIDQRLENSSMGGMWEFPGGKKESNESIEKTIERELKEELGVDVNVGDKLISFEHRYSHKKLYFTVHICSIKSGEPKPLSCQKFLWVSPNSLSDFPFPAANSKIISELHKYLGN